MSVAEKSVGKTIVGKVVSDARDKTIAVEIEWSTRHARYHKVQKKFTKIHVHDANNECSVGDKVRVKECRPLSKNKSWMLVEILEKGINK